MDRYHIGYESGYANNFESKAMAENDSVDFSGKQDVSELQQSAFYVDSVNNMLSSAQRHNALPTHIGSHYGIRGYSLERGSPYGHDIHSTSIDENLVDGQPYSRLIDMQRSMNNAFQLNSIQNSPIVPQNIQNKLIHQTGQLYAVEYTQPIDEPYRTNSTNNLAEFYNCMIGDHRNVNYENVFQHPIRSEDSVVRNNITNNFVPEESKYMFANEQEMTPIEDSRSTYDHYHHNYIASTTYSNNSLEKINEGHQSSHSTLDQSLSMSCTPINFQTLSSGSEYEKKVIYTPVSAQTSVSEFGSLSELTVSELAVSDSIPVLDPGSISAQIPIPDRISENVSMSKLQMTEQIQISERTYTTELQQDSSTNLNNPNTKETEEAKESKEVKETVSQSRHICHICHKRFQRPSSLQIHYYTHTGEKFFECPDPTCGKKFSVKSNMTRHFKLHQRGLKKL